VRILGSIRFYTGPINEVGYRFATGSSLIKPQGAIIDGIGLVVQYDSLDRHGMDPISAVGLVAGVMQLADLVLRVITNLHNYYRDFEAAPRCSAQLRTELKRLFLVVSNLQELSEAKLRRFSIEAELKDMVELLQEMLSRITPRHTRGVKRLQWPFKEAENKEFLSRIERFKSSFIIILNITQTYLLEALFLLTSLSHAIQEIHGNLSTLQVGTTELCRQTLCFPPI